MSRHIPDEVKDDFRLGIRNGSGTTWFRNQINCIDLWNEYGRSAVVEMLSNLAEGDNRFGVAEKAKELLDDLPKR